MSDNTIDISYLFPIRLRWKGDEVQLVDGQNQVMATHVFEGGVFHREQDLRNVAEDLDDAVQDIMKEEAGAFSIIESYLQDTFTIRENHEEK